MPTHPVENYNTNPVAKVSPNPRNPLLSEPSPQSATCGVYWYLLSKVLDPQKPCRNTQFTNGNTIFSSTVFQQQQWVFKLFFD
mmetsp:Transcript_12135/g.20106  ORF Transcript_12135/g.20106 Transcript_12135/m.20106 type:complete len:83 (-) Transcript_12135:629-877(-)